jgi:hypothetical protein
MFRPQAQAETHSNRVGQPRASRPRTEVFEQNAQATGQDHHARHHRLTQKHTADRQDHHVPYHLLACIFFLFLNRLQAQAHTGPGSSPRGSRKDLFFLFINRLQAQAQAHATAAADQVKATHYFIDSP